MFSRILNNSVASLLICTMLSMNIMPVFAEEAALERENYRIEIRSVSASSSQKNETLGQDSFLKVDVLKEAAAQPVSDEIVYEKAISQKLPTTGTSVLNKEKASEKSVSVEKVGKFKFDENDALILDEHSLSNQGIEIVSEKNVIIKSLKCEKLHLTAPNVAIQGDTAIKDLEIAVSRHGGVIATEEDAKLTIFEASMKGRIFNYGTIDLQDKSTLLLNNSAVFNIGLITGNNIILNDMKYFSNEGIVQGQKIDLRSNWLANKNIIGDKDSKVNMTAYKLFSNSGNIVADQISFVLTSAKGSFTNDGSILSSSAELNIAGKLKNKGQMRFENISGSVDQFINTQFFFFDTGSLTINFGENRHILHSGTLTITNQFTNTFTDEHSILQLNALLGNGEFVNKSAFSMFGEKQSIGIKKFINQNKEFCDKYKMFAFGNDISILRTLSNLKNEGNIVADSILFDDTFAIIRNQKDAFIKTAEPIKGKIWGFYNDGYLVSEKSSIPLKFSQFINRGSVQSATGVYFEGDCLRNYGDLQLTSPKIKKVINGESIVYGGDSASDVLKNVWKNRDIKTTDDIIVKMPIDQRREEIQKILDTTKDMNMLEAERQKLREYLEATAESEADKPAMSEIRKKILAIGVVYSRGGALLREFRQHRTEFQTCIETFAKESLHYNKLTSLYQPMSGGNVGVVILSTYYKPFLEQLKTAILEEEAEETKVIYEQRASAVPFPASELRSVIFAYNARNIAKTAANLWIYSGSEIEYLENSGHIEFLTDEIFDNPNNMKKYIDAVNAASESVKKNPEITAKANDIAKMPIEQRRKEMRNVLYTTKDMNMFEVEKQKLREYLEATAESEADKPVMSEIRKKILAIGVPSMSLAFLGEFRQRRTEFQTCIETFAKESLHYNKLTSLYQPISGHVNIAILRTYYKPFLEQLKTAILEEEAELKQAAYEKRVSAIPFPLKELNKMIATYNERHITEIKKRAIQGNPNIIGKYVSTANSEVLIVPRPFYESDLDKIKEESKKLAKIVRSKLRKMQISSNEIDKFMQNWSEGVQKLSDITDFKTWYKNTLEMIREKKVTYLKIEQKTSDPSADTEHLQAGSEASKKSPLNQIEGRHENLLINDFDLGENKCINVFRTIGDGACGLRAMAPEEIWESMNVRKWAADLLLAHLNDADGVVCEHIGCEIAFRERKGKEHQGEEENGAKVDLPTSVKAVLARVRARAGKTDGLTDNVEVVTSYINDFVRTETVEYRRNNPNLESNYLEIPSESLNYSVATALAHIMGRHLVVITRGYLPADDIGNPMLLDGLVCYDEKCNVLYDQADVSNIHISGEDEEALRGGEVARVAFRDRADNKAAIEAEARRIKSLPLLIVFKVPPVTDNVPYITPIEHFCRTRIVENTDRTAGNRAQVQQDIAQQEEKDKRIAEVIKDEIVKQKSAVTATTTAKSAIQSLVQSASPVVTTIAAAKTTVATKSSTAEKTPLKTFTHADDESELIFSNASTFVFIKSLEGLGKIQTSKVRIPKWYPFYEKQFIANDIEIIGEFSNSADINAVNTNFIFDVRNQDFNNSGKILCNTFSAKQVNIFTNSGVIESIGNIDVEAHEIKNACEPIIEKKSTAGLWAEGDCNLSSHYDGLWRWWDRGTRPSKPYYNRKEIPHRGTWRHGIWRYTDPAMCETLYDVPSSDFDFYKIGNGLIKSNRGRVNLTGSTKILNQYSMIIAAKGFTLESANGSIDNQLGNIVSLEVGTSYVRAVDFIHSCSDAKNIAVAHFLVGLQWSGWMHPDQKWPAWVAFNTSDKAQIYTAGDLHIELQNSPTITGADISCGGSIYAKFPGGAFNGSSCAKLIAEIKAFGSIFLNGKDIKLKSMMLLAGGAIGLTAKNELAIVNPDGQRYVINHKKPLDLNLDAIFEEEYKQLNPDSSFAIQKLEKLTDPQLKNISRFFIGNVPDLTKQTILYNPLTLRVLPVLLSQYVHLLGPRALNAANFLAILSGKEEKESSEAALAKIDQSDSAVFYFKTKEMSDGTEQIEHHLVIPPSLPTALRELLIVKSEGSLMLEGANITMDKALLSGESVTVVAKRTPDVKDSGKIFANASTLAATKYNVHLEADSGIETHAQIDKETHFMRTHNGYATWESVKKITPTVITAPQAVVLKGSSCELRGTTVAAKTLIDQTTNLTIGVDKERLHYYSHAEEDGLFGSSSMDRRGWYDVAAPSVLRVQEMISSCGDTLTFESIQGQLQKLYCFKPRFIETVATMESHDEVHTSGSGINFGKVSIADPLHEAWQRAIHAPNPQALIGETIRVATSLAGTVQNARKIYNAVTGGMNLSSPALFAACTFANRLVSAGFSIGSTSTTTVSHETHQIPNEIHAELIKLDCPKEVHLMGHHYVSDTFTIDTESFKISDMVNTVDVKTKTESSAINVNVIAAVAAVALTVMTAGAGAPTVATVAGEAATTAGTTAAAAESVSLASNIGSAIAGATSISHQQLEQNMHRVEHEASKIYANKFILRAGTAHITDAQIRAKLVDAIIRKDLIIESIADEFYSETNGGGFTQGLSFMALASGIQNIATDAATKITSGDIALAAAKEVTPNFIDAGEIDKRINNFAALVGEEKFNLIVGGKLIAKSAFYGKKVAGEAVTGPRAEKPDEKMHPIDGEHIEAGEIVHEVVPEEHSSWNDSYSIPLGDLIDVVSALSPVEEVAQAVYENAKAEGKSDAEAAADAKEAKKFFDDPKNQEIMQESQNTAQEIRATNRKMQATKRKIEQLEAKHPELRDKATAEALAAQAESRENENLIPEMQAARQQQQLDDALALANARRDFEAQEAALNAQTNKYLRLMVDANKSVDAFIKDHPTMAKMSGMFLDALGYVAVGVAAASGAGAFAGVVVGGAAFDFVTEKGAKEFVALCASQGRTEAEALEYGEAAAGVVEKTLAIAAIRGGIKALGGKFKHKARILSKTEAAALAKETYLNKGGKGLVNDNPVSKALTVAKENGNVEKVNKAPYSSRAMEALLKEKYPDTEVISTTMPQIGSKNVGLAGTRHQETGIVFNQKGMPVFDDIAKAEVRITEDLSHMKPEAHKIAATKQLKADIAAGKIDRNLFTPAELDDISRNKSKIGNWTWHHHEDRGRMQLIPEDIHGETGHIGGNKLWGMEKKT